MKFNNYIKRIVKDHHTVAFVGVMFIIMGLINLNDHLLENLLGINIEVGHGFILMGIFNIMLSITFLINGVSTVEASIDADKPAPDINLMQSRIEELESKIEKLQKSINETNG